MIHTYWLKRQLHSMNTWQMNQWSWWTSGAVEQLSITFSTWRHSSLMDDMKLKCHSDEISVARMISNREKMIQTAWVETTTRQHRRCAGQLPWNPAGKSEWWGGRKKSAKAKYLHREQGQKHQHVNPASHRLWRQTHGFKMILHKLFGDVMKKGRKLYKRYFPNYATCTKTI